VSDNLLDRYGAELDAPTRLAAEFAKAHPGAAEQLRLPRPQGGDPHVQRLLEGVAFLGARVRQRLDDEFPELTDSLLAVLYPHYLAPFPSRMMAQLTPKPELRRPATVPRGTLVRTEPVDGMPCRFSTSAPVTLWPIQIEPRSVRLTGLPLPPLLERAPKGAVGVLRVAFRCLDPAMTFEQLSFDRLRLHLRGGGQARQALYELLCNHVVAVAVAENIDDPRPVVLDRTPGHIDEQELVRKSKIFRQQTEPGEPLRGPRQQRLIRREADRPRVAADRPRSAHPTANGARRQGVLLFGPRCGGGDEGVGPAGAGGAADRSVGPCGVRGAIAEPAGSGGVRRVGAGVSGARGRVRGEPGAGGGGGA
jgi:hypothetical protein